MSDIASQKSPEAEQRFLASVSHEIRTPLNGILGMASLLSETELTPAQADYVAAIRQSGARLLDLLNNVLDYARMDATGIELELRDVSLVQLAQDVVELLSSRAHEKGLDICVRAESGFPALLQLDDGRMRQILFNLCGNAIKFTDKGGVLIDLLQIDEELVIRVIDSGPGLSKAEQTSLFQAFGQANAKDREKDGGVGLGLTIVERLVTAMNGTIQLISDKGIGACFEVRLPAPETRQTKRAMRKDNPKPLRIGFKGLSAPLMLSLFEMLKETGHKLLSDPAPNTEIDVWIADASLLPDTLKSLSENAPLITLIRPEDKTHVEALRDLGSSAYLMRPIRRASLFSRLKALEDDGVLVGGETVVETPIPVQDARVLIADDNAVNTLLASRALEKSGYACISAITGAEAVQAVQSLSFDLILMDLRMPVMDGFEAMRQIRALDSKIAKIPMIAISAEINPEVEKAAFQAGANAVASKPLDPGTLRKLADHWMNR